MSGRKARGNVLSAVGRFVNLGMQLVIIALGVTFTFSENDAVAFPSLILWCLATILYGGFVVLSLRGVVRRAERGETAQSFGGSGLFRVASMVQTWLSSLIGLGATVLVLLTPKGGADEVTAKFVGVLAMILSWGLMHWGFAQVYANEQRRRGRLFDFPGTEDPNLVDFAYLSFTMGTTFAVSDVDARTSRARWLLLGHSVLSFFYNGLIIVFALNIIQSIGGS